ncbi:MAG: DDE-type integrase/transposase/recombinase [Brevinematales bacterium]|nr:DDE-type integrase/transposase/recombinase [Brevinematales bacterium]
MINISVNSILIGNGQNGKQIRERILWMNASDTAITIDVDSPTALPEKRSVSIILEIIEQGALVIADTDPYGGYISEKSIDEKSKHIRDKAWEIVEPLILETPGVFEKELRGQLVKKTVANFGVNTHTVYRYLRRYWQRGMNKNALIPDYYYCGGRGKEKRAGIKKIGRPRKLSAITGEGINIDESIKKVFRIAIDRFYDTSKKNPLTVAFKLMLKEYFTQGYRIEDGIKKPLLIPEKDRPTFTQFSYLFAKESNLKKSVSSRYGAKKYELIYRPILGRSDAGLLGPGSLYQIDATIGDVYLASAFNRDLIIGRPVIYMVIDVFTRVVAGMYVGLEGPSWVGAMMALSNAASDKVNFCAEYGIIIGENDWPCKHIPEAILADRGEMEGGKPETMIESLHVKIQNASPYRGDMKGIIERHFLTIKDKVKPFVPGFVDVDFKERGARDYRMDAHMDIREFTALIIKMVVKYNNNKWLGHIWLDEMAIGDDVDPVPLKLWNWGIKNRVGKLRWIPEDIVKLNLMPTGTASVTERGIRFASMYYKSEKTVSENWFERARNKGSWRIDISYEPRNMDFIYIRSADGRSFDKCHLIESRGRMGKSIEDIEFIEAYLKLKKKINEGASLQAEIDLFAEIDDIVKKAKKEKNSGVGDKESKSARVKNIRNNRANEKLVNRKSEAFELGDKINGPQLVDFEDAPTEENERSKGIIDIDYIIKKQQERLNRKDE